MEGGDEGRPRFLRYLPQKTVKTEKATRGAGESRQEKEDRRGGAFFLGEHSAGQGASSEKTNA